MDPWDYHYYDERVWAEVHSIGTLVVPVRVLRGDLKAHVRERLERIFDALWTEVRMRSAKTTGTTAARAGSWDRKLAWLWQHRVQQRP